MSSINYNTQQTKVKLEQIQLEDTLKVIITEEFLNKVKWLCKKIAKVEWSGMLFYDMEGSIRQPESIVITPKDIFLRDIGTAGFTDYEYDEECMEFIEANDLLMSKHGHIHSHNTMGVFFSNTDVEELGDNAQNHNLYFSLIVNNYSDMIGKVVFIAKPIAFMCPDENGEQYEIEIEGREKVIIQYDCEVVTPVEEIKVEDKFLKVYKSVKHKSKLKKEKEEEDRKKRAAELAARNSMAISTTQGQSIKPSNNYGGYGEHRNFIEGQHLEFDFAGQEGWITDIEPDDDANIDEETEDFISYCLNGGSAPHEELEFLIQGITVSDTGEIIANFVIENYATYYNSFYYGEQFGIEEDDFTDRLNYFASFCEEQEHSHPWLALLRQGLALILSKFKELNLNIKEN